MLTAGLTVGLTVGLATLGGVATMRAIGRRRGTRHGSRHSATGLAARTALGPPTAAHLAAREHVVTAIAEAALTPPDLVRGEIGALRTDFDWFRNFDRFLRHPYLIQFGAMRRGPDRQISIEGTLRGIALVVSADHALSVASAACPDRSFTDLMSEVTADADATQRERKLIADVLGQYQPGRERITHMIGLDHRLRPLFVDVAVRCLRLALTDVPDDARRGQVDAWVREIAASLRKLDQKSAWR